MKGLNKQEKLVLFDGVCNLCDSSVQFIIKHDKKNIFKFTTLQGESAKTLITAFKIDTSKTDSILLYTPKHRLYSKSTAALKIASQLNFPINLLSIFLIIPKFIRDYVYDFIAKNRYKWYGKKEACMIPTKALKVKFLE
ncbi:thiol-disulfide oxidoreductase DCC family protein [Formosa sediminum]|uniref:Thiol-disulfide oxidoreductase DCC family protein n=1 Tax=Formosa sediminum TaxID=2594004 RepID=A0A516GTL1_9FLAO|nr:thiol-disulfide oxidoreductase DCC family protein [Formosa sediminum]QDO94832.1 thiol-disulfide oxidoreductase DCC family protein [Formosa sediminum]